MWVVYIWHSQFCRTLSYHQQSFTYSLHNNCNENYKRFISDVKIQSVFNRLMGTKKTVSKFKPSSNAAINTWDVKRQLMLQNTAAQCHQLQTSWHRSLDGLEQMSGSDCIQCSPWLSVCPSLTVLLHTTPLSCAESNSLTADVWHAQITMKMTVRGRWRTGYKDHL